MRIVFVLLIGLTGLSGSDVMGETAADPVDASPLEVWLTFLVKPAQCMGTCVVSNTLLAKSRST